MLAKLSLASRYFRTRRGMTRVVAGFALSGIVLGVAALIVVMSVMAGFRQELMDRILGITGHATIVVPDMGLVDAYQVRTRAQALDGVISADPFVHGQAMAMTGSSATGVLIRGMDPETASALPFQRVTSGDPLGLNEPHSIMLGSALAKKLRAAVGSTITLISPQGKSTPFGFIPRMQRYRVVAIFELGMQLYDSSWAYLSVPSAQTFFEMGDRLSGLDVRVVDPDHINRYRTQLLGAASWPDSYVATWRDSNAQFFEALQVERAAMFIILSLIVIVAAFNIITGQTMAVNDKRGDIAMLRTMGATKRDVLTVFLINGVLVGAIGTTLGLICGVVIVENLHGIVTVLETAFGVAIFSGEAYFLDEIPAILNPYEIIFVGAFSFVLAVLAALQPAYKAARLNPVEVLHG